MTPIGAVSAAVLALIGVFIQLKSISDQYWAVEKERQAFYARGGTAQQAQQITSGSVANQIRASQQQGLGGQAAAIGFINALGGFGPTGQLGGGLQAQTGQVSGIIGQLMQGVANYTGHDFPGMGTAGAGYGVGVPEMWEGKGGSKIMFMPRENGQFTPMGAGGGGLTVTIGAIYANDAAGGAAAAESFEKRLSQLYKGRGN